MPLQPIRIKAYLYSFSDSQPPHWRVDNPTGDGGYWGGDLFNFAWIGDTLKLEGFDIPASQTITWDLYWVRVPGW